jgi:hypothetical protein
MANKLLGFDFLVEYKKGKENLVANTLSRKFDNAPAMLTALIFPTDNWISTLWDSYSEDPKLKKLISDFAGHKLDETKYDMKDGLLFYKGRLYISDFSVLKNQLLHLSHGSPQAGHSGFHKTLSRARANFYWMGMKADIKNFIKECDICQRNKNETIHPAGLLQPLPIPTKVWADISLEFIEGLPLSNGFKVILVVVDRLSKYAHFISVAHPYTATKIAQIFIANIFKLHGMPTSIVNDRDPVFTSLFWKELFKLHGTELKFSSAYHPQTDGQTEIVNKCVEQYLRCFSRDKPKEWSR